MNPVLPLVLLMLVTLTLGNEQNDKIEKIEVKVYYEALCIFSRQFFSNQLQPSMVRKGRLLYTDLKLIPYGNAVKRTNPITGEITLGCQHGWRECELNALHVCIIENIDIWDAFDVISCLMKMYKTEFLVCAERYDVNVQAIKNCMTNRTIEEILDVYGEETEANNINSVPSVEFGNEFDIDEQGELLADFDEVFCQKFRHKFDYHLPGC